MTKKGVDGGRDRAHTRSVCIPPRHLLRTQPSVLAPDEKLNWMASIPFFGVHLMCLFVFYVGAKPVELLVCLGRYLVRMWGIPAGFRRYFSHRAYKTNRVFQFILA